MNRNSQTLPEIDRTGFPDNKEGIDNNQTSRVIHPSDGTNLQIIQYNSPKQTNRNNNQQILGNDVEISHDNPGMLTTNEQTNGNSTHDDTDHHPNVRNSERYSAAKVQSKDMEEDTKQTDMAASSPASLLGGAVEEVQPSWSSSNESMLSLTEVNSTNVADNGGKENITFDFITLQGDFACTYLKKNIYCTRPCKKCK